MKKTRLGTFCWFFILVSASLMLSTGCSALRADQETTGQRSRDSFDKDWRFKLYDVGTDDSAWELQKSGYDDSAWRVLNLPHDWAVEQGFDINLPNNTGRLPSPGLGWYRKHFKIDAADQGKRIFVDFDGAMSHSTIWLNGHEVGGWPYGYTSFRVELTDSLNYGGDNVLAVRLDNPELSSRWYPGGGIYRHTWLVKTAPVHVTHWGTYITTPPSTPDTARIDIQTEIQNQSAQDATVSVEQAVFKRNGSKPIASKTLDSLTVSAGATHDCSTMLSVDDPIMWDIEKPYLYTVRTTITQAGEVVDVYETPFGIRTIEFDADKGFLLNGKHVRLNGVCMHHDLGPLGAAMNRRAVERQVEILKEMGCNAIRTSHNPPTPELLGLSQEVFH